MRKVLDVIWGERKQEYFCKQDWTGNAPDGQISPVGWVEPFAKPIIFANLQLMGIASFHPSYGPRFSSRSSDGAQRNPGSHERTSPGFRGVSHRARVRATRWLHPGYNEFA